MGRGLISSSAPLALEKRGQPPPGGARHADQPHPGIEQGPGNQQHRGSRPRRMLLAEGVGVPPFGLPRYRQHLRLVPSGPDGNVLDRSRIVGENPHHLPGRQAGHGFPGFPDCVAEQPHGNFQRMPGSGRSGLLLAETFRGWRWYFHRGESTLDGPRVFDVVGHCITIWRLVFPSACGWIIRSHRRPIRHPR